MDSHGIVEVLAALDPADLKLMLDQHDSLDRRIADMKPRNTYHRRKFRVPSDADKNTFRARFQHGVLIMTIQKFPVSAKGVVRPPGYSDRQEIPLSGDVNAPIMSNTSGNMGAGRTDVRLME